MGEGIVLHSGPCSSVELDSALYWLPGELLARLQTFQPRRAGLPSRALGELQGLLTHPPLVQPTCPSMGPRARRRVPGAPPPCGTPASLCILLGPCQGRESWGCHSGPWVGRSLVTVPVPAVGQAASRASAYATGSPQQSSPPRRLSLSPAETLSLPSGR